MELAQIGPDEKLYTLGHPNRRAFKVGPEYLAVDRVQLRYVYREITATPPLTSSLLLTAYKAAK